MQKETVKSMTDGNPTKLILAFTIPMLIGNLFQQLYNMVDSIIVGKYVGSDALAAVGATGSLIFLFFSLSFGISAGIGVVVSQFFGAGKDDDVERSIANGTYLLILVSFIMCIVSVALARTVLKMLNTPASIIDNAVIYMRTSCAGILAIAAYNGVSAILRALGDSKTPLYFMLVSCFINIGLDFLFVVGFNWSVFGAAFATVIAQAVAAAGCIFYAVKKISFFKVKKKNRRVNLYLINSCFRMGMPIALQNSLIAISCIVLQRVVNGFGEAVIAAYTALGRIEQIVQQPYSSLGAALTAYTGQNMGAGKVDRVKKGYRVGLVSVLIFSMAMLIPGQLLGNQIMHLFVNEAEVIRIGAWGLRITSCFYFFLGMIYVARSVLNGAGDAFYAFINGILEVSCRVGFAKPLTLIPTIGMWGIFLTTGLTWTITGIISMVRYYRGRWAKKVLVKDL